MLLHTSFFLHSLSICQLQLGWRRRAFRKFFGGSICGHSPRGARVCQGIRIVWETRLVHQCISMPFDLWVSHLASPLPQKATGTATIPLSYLILSTFCCPLFLLRVLRFGIVLAVSTWRSSGINNSNKDLKVYACLCGPRSDVRPWQPLLLPAWRFGSTDTQDLAGIQCLNPLGQTIIIQPHVSESFWQDLQKARDGLMLAEWAPLKILRFFRLNWLLGKRLISIPGLQDVAKIVDGKDVKPGMK